MTTTTTQTTQQPQSVMFTLNDVIKDAQRIHEFRGDRSYALSSFLREVDTILPLVADTPQAKQYILNRVIINKIQGRALDVIRTLGNNPSWDNIKKELINNYGIRESYHQLYSKAFETEKRNVSDVFNHLCNILNRLNEKYEFDVEKPEEFKPLNKENIILKTFLNNINVNLASIIINIGINNLREAYNFLLSENLIKVYEKYPIRFKMPNIQSTNNTEQSKNNDHHTKFNGHNGQYRQFNNNNSSGQYKHSNININGQYRNYNNNSGQYRNFNNNNSGQYRNSNSNNSGQYRNSNNTNSGQYRNINNNNSGQYRLFNNNNNGQYNNWNNLQAEPMEIDHIEESNFYLDPTQTVHR